MRVVLLTQFPWIAQRLSGFFRQLSHETCAVISPEASAHMDWSGSQMTQRPTFIARVSGIKPIVAATRVDALLCWAFPWKVPAEVLALPALGAINLHPSSLPKYRGPLPLAWALRNGDDRIGVTWHRMTNRFDAGPVLAHGTFAVSDEDCDIMTIGQKVDAAGEALLPDVIAKLNSREPGVHQRDDEATPAPRFADDDYATVDWKAPARLIHNQVRAWACSGLARTMRAPRATVDGRSFVLERTSLTPADGGRAVETGAGLLWVTRSSELHD
jgi:methionyl-tRNA formyltransferase